MNNPNLKKSCVYSNTWLSSCISWLFPGIGHLYLGYISSGLFFLSMLVLMQIGGTLSLMVESCPLIVTLIFGLTMGLFLPLIAILDIRRRSRHNKETEDQQETTKDFWLAIFLSLLLPGLGHLYLRKKVLGFFFICVYLSVNVFATDFIYCPVILFTLKTLYLIHIYFVTVPSDRKKKITFISFLIFMLFVTLFGKLVEPIISYRYLLAYAPTSGSSMEPTFYDGDIMVINLIAYKFSEPCIGDIVAIKPPKSISVDKKMWLVKRIVAVSGETIQIVNGKINVDGKERTFLMEEQKNYTSNNEKKLSEKYSGYGVQKPYTVSEGKYFVLGDNLQDSTDSRYFQAVPRESIIGKVTKRAWRFLNIIGKREKEMP